MTAILAAHVAAVVLPICCLALLVVIGIQLDFGQPEHAPPTFKPPRPAPSQRADWARDFAAVRVEIAAQREARRQRREDTGWWANTDEFEEARERFFGQPAEEPVEVA